MCLKWAFNFVMWWRKELCLIFLYIDFVVSFWYNFSGFFVCFVLFINCYIADKVKQKPIWLPNYLKYQKKPNFQQFKPSLSLAVICITSPLRQLKPATWRSKWLDPVLLLSDHLQLISPCTLSRCAQELSSSFNFYHEDPQSLWFDF